MPAEDEAPVDELRRLEAELEASGRRIAELEREFDDTNRGLIALYAELDDARQAEARLAAIVRSSRDAIFSMTPDKVVQTWNPGAQQLLGRTAAQIVGQRVDGLVPAELWGEFDSAVERVLAGGHAEQYDARWRCEGGDLVDVAITLSEIHGPGGALIGVSAVLRDITRRLKAEAEVAAARANQQMWADRDRIARDLHDTVIQRIFGAALSLQGVASLETRPKLAARIEEVVEQLDVTIRELRTAIFALHRARHDTTGLRVRLLDLASTAQRALGFTPVVVFTGPIDTTVPEDIAIHVLATTQEALSNVARHALATAAEVSVSAGSELVLQVDDNGCGLGPITRTSGLRNLRERAEALGGVFDVTSPGSTGTGTRLEWRIPLT